jgi:hypothetical protein
VTDPAKKRATYADLEAVPEHFVAEIIDGALVTHSHGQPLLAMCRTALSCEIGRSFRFSRWRADGWLILTLPELHLGEQVIVPDICAWRAERVSVPPETHFDFAPDWVCEIVSDETARYDRGRKREIYAEFGVSNLWLLDPHWRVLETFANVAGKWQCTDTYADGDEVNASPFKTVSFPMSALWPLDAPRQKNKNFQETTAGDR